MSETLDLRGRLYKLQYCPCAVHAAHSCVVKTSQHVFVDTLQVPGYLRHGRQRHKEQIDADSRIFHLDQRDESFWHGVQLGYELLVGHAPKYGFEVIEVVVEGDLLGRNNEGVDIRCWS